MSVPRLQISDRLRELMSFRRLTGETPRVLVLRSHYWLDGGCLNAANILGWQVEAVPVVMEGTLSRDAVAKLLETIITFRPDFILSINLSGMDTNGMFAALFDDLQTPHVTWFVDDPRTILMRNPAYASNRTIALTWDDAYAPHLREVGFPFVEWFPLATDPAVFNAPPGESCFPPTFVGNSMEAFSERAWAGLDAYPHLKQVARDVFDAGLVTRENFIAGVDRIVGSDIAATLDAETDRLLEMLFFIEGTRRLRRTYAEALVPEGLELRGDEGWARNFPQSGDPLTYLDQLPTFYGQCALNFNATSIQMPNTVNQRVFDCPAAGGFLLTDAQPDLERLFDVKHEVAQYRSVEECVDLFRYFRSREDARRPIIEAARARILSEHTFVHRMLRIVDLVRKHFA
ncbi:MAG: glycosyltransferase [Candidatus Hydrogenedentes bacterium]|nr:glycosyltransferase [Candidatus Hydrogenedentota bacterium]